MKKYLLTFLFLLSFACSGQTVRSAIVDELGRVIAVSPPPQMIGSFVSEPSLEEKLLRYADECYNDSTQTGESYHVGQLRSTCEVATEWGNLPNSRCIKVSHYAQKTIHRKPTFEGFVEWLRKK